VRWAAEISAPEGFRRDEVVAAIRYMKNKRAQFDLSDVDFERLQEIADKRVFPPDAEFSIITQFRLEDGHEYLIWSLRLGLKKMSNLEPYPQFCDIFRTQYIRATRIDGNIAWGSVAENGLQAGVSFGLHEGPYKVGQRVTPKFFVRNSSDKVQELSFPNIITHSYYQKLEVLDESGEPVPFKQDEDPAGPVGWQEVSFGFGAQHDINGLPIVLGTAERGDAETAIDAKPGQTIRVRFTLDDYADSDAADLETGEVSFTIETDTDTITKDTSIDPRNDASMDPRKAFGR